MEHVEGFIYFALLMAVYLAPTWIAPRGRRGSVFVLNMFFGWTLIGWVVALFIAMRSKEIAKGGA